MIRYGTLRNPCSTTQNLIIYWQIPPPPAGYNCHMLCNRLRCRYQRKSGYSRKMAIEVPPDAVMDGRPSDRHVTFFLMSELWFVEVWYVSGCCHSSLTRGIYIVHKFIIHNKQEGYICFSRYCDRNMGGGLLVSYFNIASENKLLDFHTAINAGLDHHLGLRVFD